MELTKGKVGQEEAIDTYHTPHIMFYYYHTNSLSVNAQKQDHTLSTNTQH